MFRKAAKSAKRSVAFRIKNPVYDQVVITARIAIKSATADVEAAKMDVEKARPPVKAGNCGAVPVIIRTVCTLREVKKKLHWLKQKQH